MKLKDFTKKFPSVDVSDMSVNPLELIGHQDFRGFGPDDYRDSAIKKAIKAKVSFRSTVNYIAKLAERCLAVVCPQCKKRMVRANISGGSMQMHSFGYHCKRCNLSVGLEIPVDGISVTFRKKSE